ncbi:MAG: YhcH/YjgK/YiaL family protein [Bacteroidaceae bacterium]|nr:YhcH/YjgK/YiaL family protein [Bacteroidaceae bacterium]
MLYDHIHNLETYAGLSPDIMVGLKFLRDAKPDIANGVYQLTPRVKAIVSEYETKPYNENGYEAHRQYIDIQFTLKGTERIACLPIEKLTETKPYDEDGDYTLYSSDAIHQPLEMTIGAGYFAIFFPQDGHMPGLSAPTPAPVKKVVVKVLLA